MVTDDHTSFSHINIDVVDSHAEEGMDIFGKDLGRCRVYINNTKGNITGYQFFHIVSSHYHHTNISLSIQLHLLVIFVSAIINCSTRETLSLE